MRRPERYCPGNRRASRSPAICFLAIEFPIGWKRPVEGADALHCALAAAVSRNAESPFACDVDFHFITLFQLQCFNNGSRATKCKTITPPCTLTHTLHH